MTVTSGIAGVAARSAPYFFLSYAPSDPLAGNPSQDQDPDQLVRQFYADLEQAVKKRASEASELVRGFYNQDIPAGSDWKQTLNRALGAAQVFVPLYSPGYLVKSWPGRELACFKRRAQLAGLNPVRRLASVLWTPLPGRQDPPGLREALRLGSGAPGYAENGLRALLKIRSYHSSYKVVVNDLAERIVTLAEGAPIKPSEALDIDEMKSEFFLRPRLAIFVIQAIAPTAATVPPGHGGHGYGEDSTQWRPFPDQELPLAEYARQVAERFDFEAEVTGIEKAREGRPRKPGIMLIDPWFIADDAGRMALAAAIDHIQPWVLPVVVLDGGGGEHAAELAAHVRDMLGAAGALATASAQRAVDGVRSLDDFVAIIPVLVSEAERQYLRHRGGRVRSPQQPSSRPVLDYVSGPDKPAATPHSSGETPDA